MVQREFNQAKIAEILRNLRTEKGYTQKDLANELFVDVREIKYWEGSEKNGRVPSHTNREKICKIFNVSEQYLTGETKYRTPIDELVDQWESDSGEMIRWEMSLWNFADGAGINLKELDFESYKKFVRSTIKYMKKQFNELKKGGEHK